MTHFFNVAQQAQETTTTTTANFYHDPTPSALSQLGGHATQEHQLQYQADQSQSPSMRGYNQAIFLNSQLHHQAAARSIVHPDGRQDVPLSNQDSNGEPSSLFVNHNRLVTTSVGCPGDHTQQAPAPGGCQIYWLDDPTTSVHSSLAHPYSKHELRPIAPPPDDQQRSRNSIVFNDEIFASQQEEQQQHHHHQLQQQQPQSQHGCQWQECLDKTNGPCVPSSSANLNPLPVEPRIIQRVKANKKERRRTQSINQAFSELRRHIPDVPSDTKLSKIKTLRLAISYINHLVAILKRDPAVEAQQQQKQQQQQQQYVDHGTYDVPHKQKFIPEKFAAPENKGRHRTVARDLKSPSGTNASRTEEQLKTSECLVHLTKTNISITPTAQLKEPGRCKPARDRRHRTGWPEIVWSTTPSSSAATAPFNA
jgi:hypothetical protein